MSFRNRLQRTLESVKAFMESPVAEYNISQKPRSKIQGRLLTAFHILVVLFGFFLFFAAYWLGILFNALYVLLLILVAGVTVSRIIGVSVGSLELRYVCRPFDRAFLPFLLQSLNLGVFLILTVFVLQLAIVPVQFDPGQYRSMLLIAWASAAFLFIFGLIPQKKVRISTNSFFLVGWLFLGLELIRILSPPPSSSQTVLLASPFAREAYIFNGGRSTLLNHHYPLVAQRHAVDITVTKEGLDAVGDKSKLESYPAWGQILHAPADGKVVKVINDRPDLPIGETDAKRIIGNHVVLDIGRGRFVLMAHLKQGSVLVSAGDNVKQGQPLAQCGNPGNTSAPHLHLQVQSHADFNSGDLYTFPILFQDVTRVRSGKPELLKQADVRRNDTIIPATPVAPR